MTGWRPDEHPATEPRFSLRMRLWLTVGRWRESRAMGVAEKIKEILVSEINIETPPDRMVPEDSLRDTYGLDSLGFVELQVQCEEIFGIVISEEEFDAGSFATLGSLVAFVESRLGNGHGHSG